MCGAGLWSAVVELAAHYGSSQDMLDTIASADLVIAMRLHAVVMATAMGIPTVAVAYMPKVADYMASIGQSDFCADVPDVTAAWLRARVEHAVAHHEALSAELRDSASDLSERFLQNGRLLADLVGEHQA